MQIFGRWSPRLRTAFGGKGGGKGGSRPRRKGFILIMIVGALAVLVILGLSFSEQSRVDLYGAQNSRDYMAIDNVAESGFQMALRILKEDRNVWSVDNPGWDLTKGPGWTSRWGYNPYIDVAPSNAYGVVSGVKISAGAGNNSMGVPYSHRDPLNFLDSWQAMIWNDQTVASGYQAFLYPFVFALKDPLNDKHYERHPADPSMLLDTWPLQPFARVKKFRIKYGNVFAMLQISIAPKDGGINVNDVFDPGTLTERPGWHDTNDLPLYTGSKTADKYASPDRRTLDYVLGRPPEISLRESQYEMPQPKASPDPVYDDSQFVANSMAGQVYHDTGVYNYSAYFVPCGRSVDRAKAPNYYPSWFCIQLQNKDTPFLQEFMMYFNSSATQGNRYNFEGARYGLFSSTAGLSSRYSIGEGITSGLIENDSGSIVSSLEGSASRPHTWWPTGRYDFDPAYPPVTGGLGERDSLFMGFGFDFQNPKRAGVGAATTDTMVVTDNGKLRYVGAGMYGHPRARSFQYHFIAAVAGGRFWTDLMANWYFGGAAGYTCELTTRNAQNWAHLGSTFDSLGIGSNWMTPSTHVWMPGMWNRGQIDDDEEVARGLLRDPKNMPPAKSAATYVYPLARWGKDDQSLGTPQLTYMNNRTTIRAQGIQENWGIQGQDDPNGRWYDAININNSNYQVVYGLLTPEKIPSMMARSVVAPNLHWKARILDGAYEQMETFARYSDSKDQALPSDLDPAKRYKQSLSPYMFDPVNDIGPSPRDIDKWVPLVANYLYGFYKDRTQPYAPAANPPEAPIINPVNPFDFSTGMKTAIDPIDYRFSLHRQAPTERANGYVRFIDGSLKGLTDWMNISAKWRIWGKMDFTTPEPKEYWALNDDGTDKEVYRKGSGLPQDDVFLNAQYDLSLSPNTDKTADPLDGTQGPSNFNSSMMPRPDGTANWADWFMQRDTKIDPKRAEFAAPQYFPQANTSVIVLYPEGINAPGAAAGPSPKGYDTTNQIRVHPQTKAPLSKPNSLYGLPNPNYLLLYPGSNVSWNWADQYRRYFPVKPSPPVPDPLLPGSPQYKEKLMDNLVPAPGDVAPFPSEELIQPAAPVTKTLAGDETVAFVPGVNKDEAWRITRIGRKYQEIVADEIMDYQINPWWPSPAQMFPTTPLGTPEVGVPLDREHCIANPVRQVALAELTAKGYGSQDCPWPSLYEAQKRTAPGLEYNIPDYYLTFNRFWMRAGTKYSRSDTARGEPYAAGELPANAVEAVDLYPKPYSYLGARSDKPELKDRIKDFPENTLEDQMGSEYRYVTTAAYFCGSEPRMSYAPIRNHPFKNWGDFVAFLGHLVYRAPFNGDQTASPDVPVCGVTSPTAQGDHGTRAQKGIRDYLIGVSAYKVCHDPANPNVDPRNKNQFFDGSVVAVPGGDKTADALQGYYTFNDGSPKGAVTPAAGGRTQDEAIVALDGYWPVSANYGVLPGPYSAAPATPEAMLYPAPPPGSPWTGGGAAEDEWRRRVDEMRGRDAAGLRVEQNYISEQAANDILVSLSNGRIGPIDFDGNGYVEMTRKQDLPYADQKQDPATGLAVAAPGKNKYWDGFPWNNAAGDDPLVQAQQAPTGATDLNDYLGLGDGLLYGVRVKDKWKWQKVKKNEVIQDCVTLPIKFRSNTFRVTVEVELTDSRYRNVYATHRYSRVYSRLPGVPSNGIKVYGRYTGEFLLHGTRSIGGVDPEMSWLGVQ